jgi:hypothetical protein
VTLGGGPARIDLASIYPLTVEDPMLDLVGPRHEVVLDAVELVDGEHYDQIYLEGRTPEGERFRVGMGGGADGRVDLFVRSEDMDETHYLVRPDVEPRDAMTTVSSGGQSTDQLERWLPDRSEARRALEYYLATSELSPDQEWELFDHRLFAELIRRR